MSDRDLRYQRTNKDIMRDLLPFRQMHEKTIKRVGSQQSGVERQESEVPNPRSVRVLSWIVLFG